MRDDEGAADEPRSTPGDDPPSEEPVPGGRQTDGQSGDADSSSPAGPAGDPDIRGPGVPGDQGDTAARGNPPANPDAPEEREEEEEEYGWLLYLYDLVSSVAIVLLIGGLLFAASGVWPPMVAIESPSMEPTMERGDLVYVMEADRFPGEGAHQESGVVTAASGRTTGYEKFGNYGDVIVFEPDGNSERTPIIHRAMLWVEKDERWVDRANPQYLRGADSCDDLPDSVCPADHAGFITKGDNNPSYDQVSGIVRDGPVKPEWVIGTAELHVPYLGQIRLNSAGASASPVEASDAPEAASSGYESAEISVGVERPDRSLVNGTENAVSPHPGTVIAFEATG